ncbi:MAG: DUF3047 domain-containing protein [Leptothrix sp. (in: b-proteobacteria)]
MNCFLTRLRSTRSLAAALLLLGAGLLQGCAAPVPSDAECASVVGWQDWPLPGKTATTYQTEQIDGRATVHARADSAASMLRRKVVLSPDELGRLRYSWRVPALIPGADLTLRDTEDSPVRVVLAFDGDHNRLGFKDQSMFDLAEMVTGERPPYATLMYVWENHAAPETVILNPRTARIRKIVVESGPQRLNRWLSYERDIAADYRRAFGEEPGRLIGVALMTDSDNTRSRTEAWYGPIELVSAAGALR